MRSEFEFKTTENWFLFNKLNYEQDEVKEIDKVLCMLGYGTHRSIGERFTFTFTPEPRMRGGTMSDLRMEDDFNAALIFNSAYQFNEMVSIGQNFLLSKQPQ